MNQGSPSVSVVIPSYNREVLILPTLDSIRNQTLRPREVLVIDDRSTDTTVRVVEEMPPVTLIFRCAAWSRRRTRESARRATAASGRPPENGSPSLTRTTCGSLIT